MTYHSGLKLLNLESLEVRRLRSWRLLTKHYWVLYALRMIHCLCCEINGIYAAIITPTKARCAKLDEVFFSTTVVDIWNNLAADTTDFKQSAQVLRISQYKLLI